MTFRHTDKLAAAYRHDVNVSRSIAALLRQRGFVVALHDIRDAAGARLHPATLKCGHCWILARRVSAVQMPEDRTFLGSHVSYWQAGTDLGDLVQWLTMQHMQHWNS